MTPILEMSTSWNMSHGTLVVARPDALEKAWDSELEVGRSHHGIQKGATPTMVTLNYYDSGKEWSDVFKMTEEEQWIPYLRRMPRLFKTIHKLLSIDVHYKTFVTDRPNNISKITPCEEIVIHVVKRFIHE